MSYVRRLVRTEDLAADSIRFKVPVVILPDAKTVDISSTGVKWTSARFKITPKAHVKDIVLRTSFSAGATDYTLAIYLRDVSTGNKIVEVSGNELTDAEASAAAQGTLGNLPDDGLVEVAVECTAASSSASSCTVKYIVLEIVYGFK